MKNSIHLQTVKPNIKLKKNKIKCVKKVCYIKSTKEADVLKTISSLSIKKPGLSNLNAVALDKA